MNLPPMTASAEFPCEFCGGQFAHVDCLVAIPDHDCAQVERDNVDLHQALAEGVRLVHVAYQILSREHDDTECGPDCHVGAALGMLGSAQHQMREVLDRTSRPVA